jgi:hypothetical protein
MYFTETRQQVVFLILAPSFEYLSVSGLHSSCGHKIRGYLNILISADLFQVKNGQKCKLCILLYLLIVVLAINTALKTAR